MRRRLVLKIAMPFVFVFLAPLASQALEPTDAFPPTMFSVKLAARPPPGEAFTKTLRIVDPNSDCAVNQTYAFNFTPAYPDCFRSRLIPAPVSWNIAASMGVRVNGRNWDSTACMLGDISHRGANDTPKCSDAFQGNAGPGLLFGVAGAPLLRTFQIAAGGDTVQMGAALDNVGVMSVNSAGQSIFAALGDGVQGFGGLVQIIGPVLITSPEIGAPLAGIGAGVAVIGSVISLFADLNPENSTPARQDCLGGLLGNPPSGSMSPQDSVGTTATGRQLYKGTQNGPLFLTIPTQMDFVPSDPPWAFGACQAATKVTFAIDRPLNPGTNAWSDGLAFQPRAPDSAVVRRRNAVESFRVDPVRQRIEHDSWRYAPFETTFDPADGLAVCNGPQSCSPRAWAEPVGGYIAGAADPSMQHPPITTHAETPLTALSPGPSQLALFFVDDTGRLYISAATYDASDVPTWRTWLLAAGLPANAPVSAVRGYQWDTYRYTLFWVGLDGAVRSTVVVASHTQPRFAVPVSVISSLIAVPGAALAAVERTPWLPEVFVVGQNVVWLLKNDASGTWSTAPIAPSTNQVAIDSPISVVATTTNNLDIFYFDGSRTLQRLSWTEQLASWAFGSTLPRVVATTGKRQLSAVSRAPNNIDVVLPCDGAGLCNVSIPDANTFPGMLQGEASAISSVGWMSSGPLSIVAASSAALDVITASDESAFDTSWQLGAHSWSTTAPAATCDSSTCNSFNMSVAPSSVSIAANDSISVHLSTTMLNDANPINLTYNVPGGVWAGVSDPTSVTPGQGVDIGFAVPLGTPPGPKGPIIIVGSNGIETRSVKVDVTTTACVPTTCSGVQCGSISDNCGSTLSCGGSCGTGLVCRFGRCVDQQCARPLRHCPEGFAWDPVECACEPHDAGGHPQ